MTASTVCFLRRVLLSSAVPLMCLVAWGCGGDDPSDASPVSTVAGASGAGTSGGGGQAGGLAGAPAPQPVACGNRTCTPRASPLTSLIGGLGGLISLPSGVTCCRDESLGICGAAAAEGAACELFAVPDTRCPGLDLGALGAAAGGATAGLSAFGCCTSSGACGLDGSLFGRGCVENGEVKTLLSAIPLVGTLIAIPAPLGCDRPLDDAGTPDAGN